MTNNKNSNLFSIKKGEKYPISIVVRNRDEDKPIDLTGSVIYFRLKDELKDEFNILEKKITENTDVYTDGRIVDAKNGQIVLRFNDTDYDKLVCERVYYATILWNLPEQDFSKVISSNCGETFRFKVCYP